MNKISTGLLFDKDNKLLIYLRDNKPSIPFPNHWDLFGGYIEDGETPLMALRREVKEELGFDLDKATFYKKFVCLDGDIKPNIKYVFWAKINVKPDDLVLSEGQRMTSITLEDRNLFKFANILGSIIDDFAKSGIKVI